MGSPRVGALNEGGVGKIGDFRTLTLERPAASIDAFAVFQSSPCHYRWHEKFGKNGLFIIYGLVQKNKRHGKSASSINQADINIPRTTDCVNWRTRQHFVYWHEYKSTCVCTRLQGDYSHSTMFSFAYCAHFCQTFAAHWTITTLAHSNSSVAVALRVDLTVDPWFEHLRRCVADGDYGDCRSTALLLFAVAARTSSPDNWWRKSRLDMLEPVTLR